MRARARREDGADQILRGTARRRRPDVGVLVDGCPSSHGDGLFVRREVAHAVRAAAEMPLEACADVCLEDAVPVLVDEIRQFPARHLCNPQGNNDTPPHSSDAAAGTEVTGCGVRIKSCRVRHEIS